MRYDAFQGDASISWVAQRIVDELAGLLPTHEASQLYNTVVSAIRSAINSSDGVSWTDMGSIIVDLASLIASSAGPSKFADIVSALWNVSTLI
ncbi:hypothetical protein [Oceanobacillus kimchii]|uniref:hypothetical protein n=1 Tax=Oceanobacillus kimchii TaxID=746691 RepID=UPI000984635D|nr:hypothetical protein [Oceanobacillus kimchii]